MKKLILLLFLASVPALAQVPVSSGATKQFSCPGGDATGAINAVLSALSSGSSLEFSKSVCKISGQLLLRGKSHIQLIGNGSQIIQTTVATPCQNDSLTATPIFDIKESTDVTVTQFDLHGVGTDYCNSPSGFSSANGVEIVSSNAVKIIKNTFENFGFAAVLIQRSSGVSISGNIIVGPGPTIVPKGGNGNFAIVTNGAGTGYGNFTITNNRISNTAMGVFIGNDFAHDIVAHNDINVIGQTCVYSYGVEETDDANQCSAPQNSSGGGIVHRLNSNNKLPGTGIIISNNHDNGGQIALTQISGTKSFVGTKIQGNTFENVYSPIQVTASSPKYDAIDLVISGNVITSSTGGFGVQVFGSGVISGNEIDRIPWSCIYAGRSGRGLEILNNKLANCGNSGRGGEAERDGIYANKGTFNIHDNVVSPSSGMLHSLYSGELSTVRHSRNVVPPSYPASFNGKAKPQ